MAATARVKVKFKELLTKRLESLTQALLQDFEEVACHLEADAWENRSPGSPEASTEPPQQAEKEEVEKVCSPVADVWTPPGTPRREISEVAELPNDLASRESGSSTARPDSDARIQTPQGESNIVEEDFGDSQSDKDRDESPRTPRGTSKSSKSRPEKAEKFLSGSSSMPPQRLHMAQPADLSRSRSVPPQREGRSDSRADSILSKPRASVIQNFVTSAYSTPIKRNSAAENNRPRRMSNLLTFRPSQKAQAPVHAIVPVVRDQDERESQGSAKSCKSSDGDGMGMALSMLTNLGADKSSSFSVKRTSALAEEEDDDDDSKEGGGFEISPVWIYNDHKRMHSAKTTSWGHDSDALEEMDEEEEGSDGDSDKDDGQNLSWRKYIAKRIVIAPTSPARLAWDLTGLIFVLYDVFMIPMQAFNMPRTTLAITMMWLARIYWTIDIPLSFITGYMNNMQELEMRLRYTARSYLKTWMVVDTTLVVIDWAELAAEDLQAARAGKMLKSVRMLRMFRIFRLLKKVQVPEALQNFIMSIQSEMLLILLGIGKLMLLVALLNHFLACAWFAVGTRDLDGEATWVQVYSLSDADLMYQYTTSFHWSLTQFTGSMDIQPHNVGERKFAVAVLLFAFVVSASVVSVITSSMTRLQIVTAHQSTMITMLTQYLHDHAISRNVAARVQRNALHAFREMKKHTPESQIELLALVSEPLRVELHFEIFRPIICVHPFFKTFVDVNALATRKVCHEAVSRLSLSQGDMLFSEGEVNPLPQMYFVTSGKLRYRREGEKSYTVSVGMWAAEGTLWTPWVHLGTMTAKTEVKLTAVDAALFQTIASRFHTQDAYIFRFAQGFIKALNAVEDKSAVSDLDVGFDIREMMENCHLDNLSMRRARGSEHPGI